MESTKDKVACNICMEKKLFTDYDFDCIKCIFHMCFDCTFEYIRHNLHNNELLCPHCRTACKETRSDYDIQRMPERDEKSSEISSRSSYWDRYDDRYTDDGRSDVSLPISHDSFTCEICREIREIREYHSDDESLRQSTASTASTASTSFSDLSDSSNPSDA